MLTRNLSTPESRDLWDRVDSVADEVKKWPRWKRIEAIKEFLPLMKTEEIDNMHSYGSGLPPLEEPGKLKFGADAPMLNIRPVGDKILIKPEQQSNQTPGGLYIPEGALEPSQRATVAAVGEGRLLPTGVRSDFPFTIGDTVLYSKYGGTEVNHDGEKYLLVTEDNILAVLD